MQLDFGQATLPQDWVVNASINLVAPAETEGPALFPGRSQGLHPNVNLTVSELADPELSVEALRARQCDKLRGDLQGFKVVGEGKLTLSGGNSVPYLSYSFKPSRELVVRQAQIICKHGTRVAYLTATAPEHSFDRHWEALSKVMASYVAP